MTDDTTWLSLFIYLCNISIVILHSAVWKSGKKGFEYDGVYGKIYLSECVVLRNYLFST